LRANYALTYTKRAAILVGRYTHAHQFKRARRALKFLRTRLGRIAAERLSAAATSEFQPQALPAIETDLRPSKQ
jgi:IS5 family transposase